VADELAQDTRAEADATPQKEVRRWLLEIKLASKREREWRKTARDILERYRGKQKRRNSFNILWSNTEVLRPALYNSEPKPDVRRRFRQDDALGKAVSEVAERSIGYCLDAYDANNVFETGVIDALLPGRAVCRVRYVPQMTQAEPAGVDLETEQGEAFEGDREEVEYEQCTAEVVQWDDFLHGPGKTWEEVQWVAFRCRLTRDDLREKFGRTLGDKIELDDTADADIENERNTHELKQVFKRAALWEVWDKEGERVFFVNETYRDGLLFPAGDAEDGESPSDEERGEPPLKLKNFFPCPRPLMLVEDTGSLLPIPLYELYREQAEELDRLSMRINKVIAALKVRGVYDATLSEMDGLMKGEDNDLIAASQARAWMTNGGLEKAIWWMPIEQSAKVLQQLYLARDSAKIVVYEITGISDILRGATNPNETLGAQQLKANSASLRLQRMQREVQRYTRDVVRLMGEVIGEHFSQATLAKMTGLQFPSAVMKQQVQLQMQAQLPPPGPQQGPQGAPGPQAAPTPQGPPPEAAKMLAMPTWEDILAVLRSDMEREYRVDIETDSTIAQSLQQDMEGMKEVLTGIVEFWQGVGPAVQAGAVSIEAVKAITMTIVRRARMGLEVEDALESGLAQPKAPAAPEDNSLQVEQMKQQGEQAKQAHEAQVKVLEAQHEDQVKGAEFQANAQMEQMKQQAEAEREKAKQEHEAALEQMRLAFEQWKAELDARTKVEIGEKSAQASLQQAAMGHEAQAEEGDKQRAAEKVEPDKRHAELLDHLKSMREESQAPIRFDRGPDGKIASIKKGARQMKVLRDAKGMTIQ